jgi:hypothetical protein
MVGLSGILVSVGDALDALVGVGAEPRILVRISEIEHPNNPAMMKIVMATFDMMGILDQLPSPVLKIRLSHTEVFMSHLHSSILLSMV